MNLNGKIIVITGANGGIGSALVKELIKEGAKLILIEKNATDSSAYACDLTDKAQLKSLTQRLLAENAVVDALINCAGVGIYKSITELSEGEWETSINLNLSAPFLLTKQLLPALRKSELSLVLNIGSGMGVMPTNDRSAYCASKFGLRGLTLSLAEEFKNSKPHFCLITLGSTLTGFAGRPVEERLKLQKQGRAYFTSEWVAEKLVGIIKDESRTEEYTLYPSDYGFGTWKKPQ